MKIWLVLISLFLTGCTSAYKAGNCFKDSSSTMYSMVIGINVLNDEKYVTYNRVALFAADTDYEYGSTLEDFIKSYDKQIDCSLFYTRQDEVFLENRIDELLYRVRNSKCFNN